MDNLFDIFKYIINLIQNNILLSIMTIVGTLVGILGLLGSKKSKKELKRYEYIFKIAEQNMDKDLTNDELEQLHKQKDEIQKKLNGLNKIIQEDIPLEAQKTVLFDRLREDEKYLVESYERYRKTKVEYEKIEQHKSNIPQDILKEIEMHIMPNYLIEQKKQKYMTMLTYISVSSAILSAIPFTGFIGSMIVICSIYPLVKIFGLNLPKNKVERRKYLKKIIYYCILIILGIFNLIFGLYVMLESPYVNDVLEIIATITYLIFIIMLLIKIVPTFMKKIKTKKNNRIK